MIWDVDKAQERFNLEHTPLGRAQRKLQAFLEKQLDAKGCIRSYGTTTNLSQQLKNKLSQALEVPGGLLTLSLETRAVHDRAVKTLVDDWAGKPGWPKAIACVAVGHPSDAGWRLTTLVEWRRSRFPDLVRKHLFPDVTVVAAHGSPAERSLQTGRDEEPEKPGARVEILEGKFLIRQQVIRYGAAEDQDRERIVDENDDAGVIAAIRAALVRRL